MTSFGFITRSMLRNRTRFVFTAGSIVVAFALLGLLLPINRIFQSRVEFADASRLIVINKASMMRPLPIGYGERIGKVPGVETAGHFTFFGALYRSEANPVAAIATDPARFPAMVGEVVFRDPSAYGRWLKEPAGIAVGRQLAERLDWKVGDLVPVYSTIYPRKDGSSAWTFRISAIFDGKDPKGSTDSMVINYKYFDEERAFGNGTVGWYAVRVAKGADAAAAATAIDRQFVNSADETSTTTERAFAQSFLSQVGDFRLLIGIALVLVFWTLMLITANTMAQSIRERFAEFGVLKAIGFGRARIARLVFGESVLVLLIGGGLGMGLAAVAVPVVASQTNQLLSLLETRPSDWLIGALLMIGMGIVVAAVPAARAARQPILDGLREAV